MARRGKVCKTIEDAREALKVIVGPRGIVSVTQRVYEHYGPGNRYESADWGGSASIELVPEEFIEAQVATASSAADLVRKLAQELRLAIDAHAEARKPRRLTARPKVIESTAVRRLEHSAAEPSP
ncbi:MAG: hypothetical protein IPM64_17895 [Phycisphaerales bacterium]|nr:hypothetical protein [Phycisphaerales bacterium]